MTAVEPARDGVFLRVRLTPGAGRNAITGLAATAGGGTEIRASVTAAPEKGAANAALVRMLAKALRVPKSGIEIVAGATDRRKKLLVRGDTALLMQRVGDWLDHPGGSNG